MPPGWEIELTVHPNQPALTHFRPSRPSCHNPFIKPEKVGVENQLCTSDTASRVVTSFYVYYTILSLSYSSRPDVQLYSTMDNCSSFQKCTLTSGTSFWPLSPPISWTINGQFCGFFLILPRSWIYTVPSKVPSLSFIGRKKFFGLGLRMTDITQFNGHQFSHLSILISPSNIRIETRIDVSLIPQEIGLINSGWGGCLKWRNRPCLTWARKPTNLPESGALLIIPHDDKPFQNIKNTTKQHAQKPVNVMW